MSEKEKLGKYLIEDHLGAGAYADVYRATDTALKRVVALKVLKPMLLADEEAFARFLQEARTAADLFHPHIATVLDLGEADGRYFIAMRYVDGDSLDKVLEKRGPLPWDEALKITQEIAEALHFAHNKGLVHRDIKPQNILISPEDGAMLTDFGLVKAMTSSGLTTTGSYLGTPHYMPPEIWTDAEVCPSTDQYGLACVLVEILTGNVLYAGKTPPAVMAKHFQPPALPANWPEGTPKHLAIVVEQALNQEPGERFEEITTFVKRLNVQRSNVQTPRVQSANAQPDPVANENEITLTLAPGVDMEFIRVPAGTFLMGSSENNKDAFSAEKPQHKVHLEEYWIGKYPVTNAQYKAFVEASGYQQPGHFKNGKIPKGKNGHPVVKVSWHDARAFCHWASQISDAVIRLPTEAEWEKAAQGKEGRIYPWGDQKPDVGLCNFDKNIDGTTRVGRYSPAGDSPYGCADMAGNVWEWTSSLKKDYPYRAGDGRENLEAGDDVHRVLRGGAWNRDGDYVRAAGRGWSYPENSDYFIGFRCARSAATP